MGLTGLMGGRGVMGYADATESNKKKAFGLQKPLELRFASEGEPERAARMPESEFSRKWDAGGGARVAKGRRWGRNDWGLNFTEFLEAGGVINSPVWSGVQTQYGVSWLGVSCRKANGCSAPA